MGIATPVRYVCLGLLRVGLAHQLLPGASAAHTFRLLDDNVRASARRVIVSLDQDPLPAAGAAQAEPAVEFVAAQKERQMVWLVTQETHGSFVPHEDDATATGLAVMNPFEVATGQAVVANLDSQTAHCRIEGRSSRDCPRPHHLAHLEAQVEVQSGGVVKLDDKA
jgi:hypothetical protein